MVQLLQSDWSKSHGINFTLSDQFRRLKWGIEWPFISDIYWLIVKRMKTFQFFTFKLNYCNLIGQNCTVLILCCPTNLDARMRYWMTLYLWYLLNYRKKNENIPNLYIWLNYCHLIGLNRRPPILPRLTKLDVQNEVLNDALSLIFTEL